MTRADYPPLPLDVASERPSTGRAHLAHIEQVRVPDAIVDRLRAAAPTTIDEAARIEAGRDWWPLALHWALAGEVPCVPSVVVRPTTTSEVAAVLAICDEERIPVTPAAGRSGVCGGSVPAHGGVSLDVLGLDGITHVSDADLLVTARAGTNGLAFERGLRTGHFLTVGHWPQSIELSSVGGWVACRGAGQYSNRYGKIEDIVRGLEVVLADGTVVRTGGRAPRSAVGPDLTQLFTGSEGTLGVITEVTFAAHPMPPHEQRSAWTFATFDDGLEACRLTMRAGATPAVLRLYDGREGKRFGGDGTQAVLLVLDEGYERLVQASMAVVADACGASGGEPLDVAAVAQWLEHRNDVSGLATAVEKGVVVDTCEIVAQWSKLPAIRAEATRRFKEIPGAAVISCHQSHAYLDGACLYFTFAGFPPEGSGAVGIESLYRKAWAEIEGATLDGGGALSHHHGVGKLRAGLVEQALGAPAHAVLSSLKTALDPHGILNPGALGLASAFGRPAW